MPTILEISGWRLFFYSGEGHEPIHVHGRKGDAECKYWLDLESYEIREAHFFNGTVAEKRMVRKIIYDHFEYIVQQWVEYQQRRGK